MSQWAQKRFWDVATAGPVEGGFAVALDGRPVMTPAKAPLIVPTLEMANVIAAEWDAQDGVISPLSMPVTRSANAAIDKVQTQHSEVAELVSEYGGTDLICYRATDPQELVERQNTAWDPLLDWAAAKFDAPLERRQGVIFAPQPAVSLANLSSQVRGMTAFELTAFHDLVSLSGSLIIGLAAIHRFRPVQDLWDCGRIDELWQEEQWGKDEDSARNVQLKRDAFLHAVTFYELCG